MAERPINLRAHEVRNALANEVIQVRRVVKLRNGEYIPPSERADAPGWRQMLRRCPFGAPGDLLWVREAFEKIEGQTQPWIETDYRATYKHGHRLGDMIGMKKRWTSASRMPRAASRITQEIADVRVQRLRNISADDVIAEGAAFRRVSTGDARTGCRDCWSVGGFEALDDPVQAYELLWGSLHGRDSWAMNPWLWALTLRRIA